MYTGSAPKWRLRRSGRSHVGSSSMATAPTAVSNGGRRRPPGRHRSRASAAHEPLHLAVAGGAGIGWRWPVRGRSTLLTAVGALAAPRAARRRRRAAGGRLTLELTRISALRE